MLPGSICIPWALQCDNVIQPCGHGVWGIEVCRVLRAARKKGQRLKLCVNVNFTKARIASGFFVNLLDARALWKLVGRR